MKLGIERYLQNSEMFVLQKHLCCYVRSTIPEFSYQYHLNRKPAGAEQRQAQAYFFLLAC